MQQRMRPQDEGGYKAGIVTDAILELWQTKCTLDCKNAL